MTTLKYSRQREAIKEYLASTTSHPTADTVYLHVKEEFPRISLGTVYRNLNLLSDMGEILKITTPQGGDRFDGFTHPHYHVLCTECGSVLDLDMDIFTSFDDHANNCFSGEILSHSALFYGVCETCLSKKNHQ